MSGLTREHEARLAAMTPEQLRATADELLAQTAHRGMFVRVNAALVAGDLRRRADRAEASQPRTAPGDQP